MKTNISCKMNIVILFMVLLVIALVVVSVACGKAETEGTTAGENASGVNATGVGIISTDGKGVAGGADSAGVAATDIAANPAAGVAGNVASTTLIDPNGSSVETRIKSPEGYARTSEETDSWAEWLRKLPLKADGTPVTLYDGSRKSRKVHVAVVDMDIGNRDLQQCADAVMRLRAEYLYSLGQFERIHFNFTSGFNAEYSKWSEGWRISVNGNNCSWVRTASPSSDYEGFRKYLDMVFSYAGTLSLSKELTAVKTEDMRIGDVFIRGGSPGHAVIVIDMAQNPVTGEKLFMLAQSYMPAQDIHILKNPGNEDLSPWYSLGNGVGGASGATAGSAAVAASAAGAPGAGASSGAGTGSAVGAATGRLESMLETPEWSFTWDQLKRFP